ncbi:hypothetical protein DYB32_007667 [Aphanomyces invadans]|uniref:Uncharacterized protein n=1 Tax=Aphanomyces invadans TaxID=157072 RepID=A0A3R6Z064_9STRA|nr:hypothetical protein DYB32_007667 [Aphanomyces invadans]
MLGSAITVVIYFAIAVFCRPPPNKVEVVLSFLYCAPVIWIFNTISYYSEYSSRERFILRQRLSTERISLAVSRTLNPTPATSSSLASTSTARQPPDVSGTTLFLGVLLWGVFTLGSFASFPETFKFVDEETGWAWFIVLWLMSLVLSSQWIIFSAHSVGYTLLVASAILTFGVFSTFLQAWHQDFPLLDKIVSEYQAGFDPHVLAERQTCQDKLLSDGMDTLTLAGGETDDTHASNTIVSVLPSFKHGKCFFCNKNAIVHYVPTCGLWGKWMHWRMDANHIVAQRGATSSEKIGGLKPTVTMCTSYCDLQSKNRHLQEQMRTLTGSVASLKHQIKLIKEHESRCLTTTVQLQRAMREIADKHKHEMEVAAKVHDAKLQAALKDSNAALVALTQQRDQQRHHVQQLEAALDKETRTRLDADAVHAHLVQRIESQNSRLAQLEVDIFSRKGG